MSMAVRTRRALTLALALLGSLLLSQSVRPARATSSPQAVPPVFLPLVMRNVGSPTLAGCPMLPSDNIWNTPVDSLPVASQSSTYVNAIGATKYTHADFGSGIWDGFPIGIPYNVVTASQPVTSVTFTYADESDLGPYPIPATPLIEGDPSDPNGDRHLLIVDTSACKLYELYAADHSTGQWQAGSGAIFDLNSNALRTAGWTSADAAGLPILPGLARYDEVAAGAINHALRFTALGTNGKYIWPARHETPGASHNSSSLPPMGQRFRLKASVDISGFDPKVQVILVALKKYGMILADNGSAWYISGVPDPGWDNTALHQLDQHLPGSDFEAVDESSLMVSVDSGQAKH
jgi:hypothetical protein